LESYEVGTSSLRELAQQFRVSFGYSKKIRRQQLLTGQKERPVQWRHGPVSRIDSAAQEKLRGWLRQQPDLTEVELRERLGEAGVWVCKSRIGQVLRAGVAA
jgi:transposase